MLQKKLYFVCVGYIWKFPAGVRDRVSRRLFTKDVLQPGPGKFPEPSQKIASATSSRYFIFWVNHMMTDILQQWGAAATEYMLYPGFPQKKLCVSIAVTSTYYGFSKHCSPNVCWTYSPWLLWILRICIYLYIICLECVKIYSYIVGIAFLSLVLFSYQTTVFDQVFPSSVSSAVCMHLATLRYQGALLGSLATMELLTLQEGRIMGGAACTEFRRCYLTYRSSLNWLAAENLKLARCRYHMRPKVHQMSHLVYGFLPSNPRMFSNYLDEDYICKTKRVAESVHPLHMPMHVAMRYSIAACLRWFDGDMWRCKRWEWPSYRVPKVLVMFAEGLLDFHQATSVWWAGTGGCWKIDRKILVAQADHQITWQVLEEEW